MDEEPVDPFREGLPDLGDESQNLVLNALAGGFETVRALMAMEDEESFVAETTLRAREGGTGATSPRPLSAQRPRFIL